ncbi:DUF1819 family protein [Brenneria goodwinii]|uniref:BREX-1 system protein BrxA n=1 Tax=Brenneria goodwinii TaxID=1109412 RepID=UPI000EF28170|nr:DUF1819 family protein [Brenneria goodwinii]MCG8156476.1 DUF1819 family protein [Brenneria goodwinii]MCG8162153.1 DUF1819 family protein [Brenneria goodwinii]MCG8166805.1 DUF1819 family protein [Brenneria goodwinii]MCG8171455.1 DUF1819 family protein [Brenneria goodwinii]MCG8175123.1 DUF1819 family protein [Brenneria goodwinii]
MKSDKVWIGDLLGGSLMSRESRVIAELMLTDPDEQVWQEQIVGHNILQASSANTAKRYATTIRLRLNTLDKTSWAQIAEGSERERQQLLFVALILHSPVVKDFLSEVVNDLRRQYKEKLPADSWDEFVTNHIHQQPVLTSYSDSSITKMGNNLVKALAEAGYLDTPRRRNLQAVFLLPETQSTLQRLGQQELISILEGQR